MPNLLENKDKAKKVIEEKPKNNLDSYQESQQNIAWDTFLFVQKPVIFVTKLNIVFYIQKSMKLHY